MNHSWAWAATRCGAARGAVAGQALACLALLLVAAGPSQAAQPADPAAVRCTAMVAYAEAAGEGPAGMAAVVRVIRNRIADPRFPDDACAVVRAPGEFQPVGDSARLRLALAAPMAQDMAPSLADFGPVDAAILAQAVRLARDPGLDAPADPTGGALYFVNPRFMEPAKCPWFADLKRTAEIGGHVFMTHYAEDEAAGEPALDCAAVKVWWAAYLRDSRARGKRVGKRKINPAWLVAVEKSGLAAGRACPVGTYDPTTRTYRGAGAC